MKHVGFRHGGEGIRTPGTLTGSTVFKTAAIDHSATPPFLRVTLLSRFKQEKNELITKKTHRAANEPTKKDARIETLKAAKSADAGDVASGRELGDHTKKGLENDERRRNWGAFHLIKRSN